MSQSDPQGTKPSKGLGTKFCVSILVATKLMTASWATGSTTTGAGVGTGLETLMSLETFSISLRFQLILVSAPTRYLGLLNQDGFEMPVD